MNENRAAEVYISGDYLLKNPDWHVEESLWKAERIWEMLVRNQLKPTTVCEIGCGAGEVLRQLQLRAENSCSFWGFDISPQALELCRQRANEHLHFARMLPNELPEGQ